MTREPSGLTRATSDQVSKILDGPPTMERLNAALRLLAKWRSMVLANTHEAHAGSTVLAGPFAGMAFPVPSAEGGRAPRLLGSYEASLVPVFETIIARAYPLVVNIGSAEGYYAVGLARRMPQTRVLARDIDLNAQALCRRLAAANGVADRVEVGGEVTAADLAICADQPTVVLCDIEGAEDALLDPVAAPGLAAADILVELHPKNRPGLAERIEARFQASHRITRFGRSFTPTPLPPWAESLNDLDRLLLIWEWRASPTPWLWMERK